MLKHLLLSFAVLGCVALAGTASAGPTSEPPDPSGTSGCVVNSDNVTQTCNLYENDAAGVPTEGPVTVGLAVLAGEVFTLLTQYIVLYESNLSPQNDPNNWSDIVVLPPNSPGSILASQVTLWSDIGVGQFPVGAPTPTEVLAGLNQPTAFLLEVGPPTVFTTVFGDSIRIWSDVPGSNEEVPVPEPGTLLLLGAGLAGVAGLRRRTA